MPGSDLFLYLPSWVILSLALKIAHVTVLGVRLKVYMENLLVSSGYFLFSATSAAKKENSRIFAIGVLLIEYLYCRQLSG